MVCFPYVYASSKSFSLRHVCKLSFIHVKNTLNFNSDLTGNFYVVVYKH